ncbi:MAG: conjugal transfer protein TraN [Nevskiaceae bacterium]|nr:MAG: conjugal transfer protein TraN [Nevskiaceae bacterium]
MTRPQIRQTLVGLAWGVGACLFSVGLPVLLVYAQSDAYEQGRQTGKDGNAAAITAGQQPPESYPGFQGSNPPETGYFHSGLAIEDQARQEMPNHEVGSGVNDAAYSRPRFRLERDEPEFAREREAQAGGSALTQNYSGCQSYGHGANNESYSSASCNADAVNPLPTCQRRRTPDCPANAECELAMDVQSINSDMAWNYQYPTLTLGTIADDYWGGSCGVYDRSTSFNIDDVAMVKEFRLFEVGFDDWQLIEVNGNLVAVGPYGGDRLEVESGHVRYSPTQTGKCELKTSWRYGVNVDIRPYLRTGSNTIRMKVVVSGKGEGYMRFSVKRFCDCPDHGTDTYETSCERPIAPAPQCRIHSTSCLEGPERRTVNGVPVYRECWRYEDTYLCPEDQQNEEPACGDLRARQCEQTSSTCVAQDPNTGRCQRFRQDFRCPAGSGSASATTVCGADLYCPGGNCSAADRVTQDTGAQDMAQAATWLAAAQNASDDFDPNNFTMFKGAPMRCAKTDFGFSNCCKDSGWGNDIGFHQCSQEEEQLGFAKEGGRTHYVGSHSSGGPIDERDYKTYCVFNSKLTRIIQEQGRPQLGIAWGSSRDPDCRPLSTDEVGRLDWSRMDLSEFYQDAQAAADAAAQNIDSNQQLETRMRERIERMNQSGTPAHNGGGGG